MKPRFPALFAPNQFTPISRLAERATSRNRTLSITCCDGATFIAFTMLTFGHHGLGHLHGAVGGYRIAGERH